MTVPALFFCSRVPLFSYWNGNLYFFFSFQALYNFYVNAVGQAGFYKTSFEYPRSGFNFHKRPVVFELQQTLAKSHHTVAAVKYNIGIGTIAGPYENAFFQPDFSPDFKLYGSIFEDALSCIFSNESAG